jgi:hypothetical protein
MVEQINLRTLVLRDAEGAVQVFPNGTIGTLANMSKIYAWPSSTCVSRTATHRPRDGDHHRDRRSDGERSHGGCCCSRRSKSPAWSLLRTASP